MLMPYEDFDVLYSDVYTTPNEEQLTLVGILKDTHNKIAYHVNRQKLI